MHARCAGKPVLSVAVCEQGHVPESYTFKIALLVKSIYYTSSLVYGMLAFPIFQLGLSDDLLERCYLLSTLIYHGQYRLIQKAAHKLKEHLECSIYYDFFF